jgi:uncharacterized protein (DUF1499 family)
VRGPAKVGLVVLAAAAVFAYVHWPPLSEVETGKTPEYPDLQVQHFTAGEERLTNAARGAIAALPGWEVVGGGRGPGGSELAAVARPTLLPLKYDVTVRIRRRTGGTDLSVRSRSRVGSIDLGQNARNIRAFLAQLDRHLAQP